MDLTAFADAVGAEMPVTIAGLASRGGPVSGVRCVHAPSGIDWLQPDEMTVSCGAGTPVAELDAALAEVGQRVALPTTGTVGGALAVGRSDITRLGHGPVRDTVLQARYVSAAGSVVKAGGPTVKNVSGFDLCRLLVGSRGTLGFIGDVILRTRPRPRHAQWFTSTLAPADALAALYRPASVLWDGTMAWVLLEGHPVDVADEAARAGLTAVDGPPELPTGGRWSIPPREIDRLVGSGGRFVAEVGVGIVHHELPAPRRPVAAAVVELTDRLKQHFDPAGRLNPGVEVLVAR
jgi:glycolate oxidase FAD binding subunit